MKKLISFLFLLKIFIAFSQTADCKKIIVTDKNKEQIWNLFNQKYNNFLKTHSETDRLNCLCILEKLDDKNYYKATLRLSEEHFFARESRLIKIKDDKKARSYFNKIALYNNFKNDSEKESHSMTAYVFNYESYNEDINKSGKKILKERLRKYNDKYSAFYLASYYHFDSDSLNYYNRKACELGEPRASKSLTLNNYKPQEITNGYVQPPKPEKQEKISDGKISTTEVYETVDIEAKFPEGIPKFKIIIQTNFNKTVMNGFKGKMESIINFIVEREGSVTDIHVQSSNIEFSKEIERALRFAKTKWIPAKIKNQEVRSRVKLPFEMNFE